MGTSKLGNMLVEDGLLSETDRRTIKRTCGTGGSAFARGILAMGLLDEDELAAYIAEHTHWQVASKGLLDNVQSGAWGCIDRPLVEHLEVLPLRLMGESLQVAMVDPLDQDTLSQLEFFTGYKIQPVIATMSQVRGGLQKVMPDYQPSSSQLEDFLKNHSISASKRLRMEEESDYGDLPAPEAFSVKGPAPKKVAEAPYIPPPGAEDIEFDDDDEVEVNFSEPDSPALKVEMEAPAAAEASSDDDNLFSIEDDNFTTEIEEDAPAATAASAASADMSDDLSGDLGDALSDDLSDLGDDLFAADSDDGLEELSAAPAKASAPAVSDDLEDLGDDLSAFDPDKDDGDLDFGADLEADLGGGSTEPAAADFSDNPGAGLEADLTGDLGDDLGSDLEADFGGDLEGDPVGDLGSDFGGDLEADPAGDIEEAATVSELVTEKDEELAADFSAGEDGFDLDESGELSFDEATESDSGELTFDEPSTLDQDLDIAAAEALNDIDAAMPDIAVSEATEQISSAINKMLFAVTMSIQTKEAISQIASDLKATGFSAGMVIGGSASTGFQPECGWMETDGQPAALSADSFKAKGIAAALGRLTPAWTALDDAVRQGDLKVFASLQRENRKLFGIRFANPSAGTDTVVVTAMTDEISRNQGIMDMAADLFKQVARKDKDAA